MSASRKPLFQRLFNIYPGEEKQALLFAFLGFIWAFGSTCGLKFADALKKAKVSIHVGVMPEETAYVSNWHLPSTHFLEAWGDARAWDGTASIVQPLIQPLHGEVSKTKVYRVVYALLWPVLPLFKAPAAASTLTWTLEIIDWPGDMQAQDYWQYNVHTDAAADGYSHAQAMVWDKHGNLVAISRQTVAVFA